MISLCLVDPVPGLPGEGRSEPGEPPGGGVPGEYYLRPSRR